MSAKSRYNNRRATASKSNAVFKQTIHAVNTMAQQLSPASPFEAAQLQHLQIMIDNIAGQVMSSMKQTEENPSDSNHPKTTITLLRIYSQYLNLYMKFKDKCFSASEPLTTSASQHGAQTAAQPKVIPSANPSIPANNKLEPQRATLTKPEENRIHPEDETQSCQIKESSQRVVRNNEPNPLLPPSPINGLLMP